MGMERSLSRRNLIRGGLAGVGALTVVVLAGCGGTKSIEAVKEAPVDKAAKTEADKAITQDAAGATHERVTLEVAFPANGSNAEKLMTDIVIPSFTSKNPWIEVKYEGTPSSEYGKNLLTRIDAGAAPDVFLQEDVILPSLSARGAVVNLDEFWKRDAEQIKTVVGEDSSIDHRLNAHYGLARNAVVTAMLYNREHFEKAGVEPPAIAGPWTWQEWLQNMRKLTWDKERRSPTDTGFDPESVEQWGYWSRQSDMALEWAPWIMQNGGRMLDPETRKSTLDNAFVTEAMDFINRATWKYYVAPTPDQVAAAGKDYHVMFLSGRCASMSTLLGQESQYPTPANSKFEIKAMVLPHKKLKGVEHGVVRGASAIHQQMMIGKASKAQEDAWAFMVFQANDEESSTGVYTLANDGLPADKRYWRGPEVLQRGSYPRGVDVFIDPFETGLVAGSPAPAYAHPLWPNLAWTE